MGWEEGGWEGDVAGGGEKGKLGRVMDRVNWIGMGLDEDKSTTNGMLNEFSLI